jgi:hypothetical protein
MSHEWNSDEIMAIINETPEGWNHVELDCALARMILGARRERDAAYAEIGSLRCENHDLKGATDLLERSAAVKAARRQRDDARGERDAAHAELENLQAKHDALLRNWKLFYPDAIRERDAALAQVKHWRDNHAQVMERLRVFTDRPDLPAHMMERRQHVENIIAERDALRTDVETLRREKHWAQQEKRIAEGAEKEACDKRTDAVRERDEANRRWADTQKEWGEQVVALTGERDDARAKALYSVNVGLIADIGRANAELEAALGTLARVRAFCDHDESAYDVRTNAIEDTKNKVLDIILNPTKQAAHDTDRSAK